MRTRRVADSQTLIIVVVSLVIGWFFMNSTLLYPFRLLVTLVHECGHAVACELTGGDAGPLMIAANAGGVCRIRGGITFIVAAGGYVGSAVFGGLLLYLSSLPKYRNYILEGLGALFFLAIVFWVRDLFTFAYSACLVGALFFIGLKTNPAVEMITVKFMATITGLYALFDVKVLAQIALGARGAFIGGATRSDAHIMQELTGIPAILWALAWGAAGLWFLYKMASLATANEAREARSSASSLYGSSGSW